MKSLTIHHSDKLDWSLAEEHRINNANWDAFKYQPMVLFKTLHCDEKLFIRFIVSEDFAARAESLKDQDPVYQDSCVEFFFLREDGQYLNFESNAKGIVLSASGATRANREPASATLLSKIERFPTEIIETNRKYNWQLTLGIPFDILGATAGRRYRANFYKCGDLTEKKHYLSWSPISTDKPDFHCPEFFGEITFE